MQIVIVWALFLKGYYAAAAITERHRVNLADLETIGSPDLTMQLSPDGSMLAYALDNRSISIIPTSSKSSSREIGPGFMPIWSPDGDKLAYYATIDDCLQLFIYDLKTNKSTQLTHVPGGIDPDPETRIAGRVHDAFRYSWSPDGKHLVFASRVPLPNTSDAAIPQSPTEPTKNGLTQGPLVLTNSTPPDWCHRPAYRSQGVIGILEPADDRRNEARA